MIQLKKALSSSIGRKYVMAVTGILLVVFIIVHLLENLLLYAPSPMLFNRYVYTLDSMGPLKLVAELGLAALFAVHIVMAILVSWGNKAKRGPVGYRAWRSKSTIREGQHIEDEEKSSVGSRNMIITGLILLAFLALHIWQFRFGPGVEQGYVTQLGGTGGAQVARDLYRLLFETFHQIAYVVIYVVAVLVLGVHFRHGFWSMFQSLGLMNPKYSRPVHVLALLIATVLALGFLFIPIVIFMKGA